MYWEASMEPRSLSAAFHKVSLSSLRVVAEADSTFCSSLTELVIFLLTYNGVCVFKC